MKFTEGPWTAWEVPGLNVICIGEEGHMPHADVHDRGTNVTQISEETKANAALIASAPEMYEALRMLLDRLDEHGSIDCVREEGPIEDARNAIAKVEGN